MTPAEFKERFKVGDIIWGERSATLKYKITAIGELSFLCKNIMAETENEFSLFQSAHWVKVEPEKKPSEIIYDKYRNSTMFHLGHPTEARFQAIEKWLDENWPKVVKKGE